MNGLTLVALFAVAVALVLAWRIGVASGRRAERVLDRAALRPAVVAPVVAAGATGPQVPTASDTGIDTASGIDTPAAGTATGNASGLAIPAGMPAARPANAVIPVTGTAALDDGSWRDAGSDPGLAEERARLLRSLAAENATLRTCLADAVAIEQHLSALAEDRRRLIPMLATARAETARYRALVIDLENNAPPPLLDGPSAPDDLKLIVGIGPVLERLLQQMGITTYRQIARWSERDIDDFDARLPEFPGRIRRDAWVKQARAIHQSKYGEALPVRDR